MILSLWQKLLIQVLMNIPPETAETDESVEIRTKAFLLDAIKKVTIRYIRNISIFKFTKSNTL